MIQSRTEAHLAVLRAWVDVKEIATQKQVAADGDWRAFNAKSELLEEIRSLLGDSEG